MLTIAQWIVTAAAFVLFAVAYIGHKLS